MGFFTSKKEVRIEDFCRDFYETKILNTGVKGFDLDPTRLFAEAELARLEKQDPVFADVNLYDLAREFTCLRFELFALAFTHKFTNGKIVLRQSDFTVRFLEEIDRLDIWEDMERYNHAICGGTLAWLTNLGGIASIFKSNMRDELIKKNNEEAQVNSIDSSTLERENNRLLSEDAWKKKAIPMQLIITLGNGIGIDVMNLNPKAKVELGLIILGFYKGAKEAIDEVEIVIQDLNIDNKQIEHTYSDQREKLTKFMSEEDASTWIFEMALFVLSLEKNREAHICEQEGFFKLLNPIMDVSGEEDRPYSNEEIDRLVNSEIYLEVIDYLKQEDLWQIPRLENEED